MKKVLFALSLVFAMILTSCDKETPMLLSEYVIGEWKSQDLMLGDTEAYFTADIESDHYTLTLYVGDQFAELPDEGYSVDNENDVITIDQPQMPGEDPSDEVVPFQVTWTEDSNVMTWMPIDPLGDVPTLVWTRQVGP